MINSPANWTEMLTAYGFQERRLGDQVMYGNYRWSPEAERSLDVSHIKTVLYAVEGENEGEDWLMLCELHSGEFMHLFANCCYTGFDAAGHVYCFVAPTIKQLRSGGIRDVDAIRYLTNKRIVPTVQELVRNAVRPRT